MLTQRIAPVCGDYITGRCVTMSSMHNGTVTEIVGSRWPESTERYRIRCDDGRDRVVFHQGFATPGSDYDPAARMNAGAWAAFDALSI